MLFTWFGGLFLGPFWPPFRAIEVPFEALLGPQPAPPQPPLAAPAAPPAGRPWPPPAAPSATLYITMYKLPINRTAAVMLII